MPRAPFCLPLRKSDPLGPEMTPLSLVVLEESALGSLTALAAQALASPDPQERLQILDVFQQALKQVGDGPSGGRVSRWLAMELSWIWR